MFQLDSATHMGLALLGTPVRHSRSDFATPWEEEELEIVFEMFPLIFFNARKTFPFTHRLSCGGEEKGFDANLGGWVELREGASKVCRSLFNLSGFSRSSFAKASA